MDKGFVKTYKGMSAARMPDAALGGVPLMCNPYIGIKVFEFVVLGHLFGIPYDLKDHHVLAMGKDKGPFLAEGTVEGKVQLVCILAVSYTHLTLPTKRIV